MTGNWITLSIFFFFTKYWLHDRHITHYLCPSDRIKYQPQSHYIKDYKGTSYSLEWISSIWPQWLGNVSSENFVEISSRWHHYNDEQRQKQKTNSEISPVPYCEKYLMQCNTLQPMLHCNTWWNEQRPPGIRGYEAHDPESLEIQI